MKERILTHLKKIYKDPNKQETAKKLFDNLLSDYEKQVFPKNAPLNEENVYLITYGNSFKNENQNGLQSLNETIQNYLADVITDIHLLPMFPYTSDDGFSVTDYLEVNSDLGSWEDIQLLAESKRLMFDFVANHMSSKSVWFQKFLEEDSEFKSAFVEYDATFDSSNVTRPRTSPLFHEYHSESGKNKKVWTTFSEDQVDVNVDDPVMLTRLTGILLEYALRGASSIRLDAIGFLWKESGTTCMHLPEAHEIVKLWRTLLDHFAPNTQIITETNVPHVENISYLGNGNDEANQVYQFPLPPLVLYSFINENADKLQNWADGINPISKQTTYFNFLASHDGIGMRPTEGLLTDEERQTIVDRIEENYGKVSFKNNADGTRSIYELNINFSDALRAKNDNDQLAAKKMIAAHNILLSVVGVPAIYYHSIFGSRGDLEAAKQSGINRRINRSKIDLNQLVKELEMDPFRKQVFTGISQLIRERKKYSAFSPYGKQEILKENKQIFAVKRKGNDIETLISYTNVSAQSQSIENVRGLDVITGQQVEGSFILEPFGVSWILLKEDK